MTTFSAPPHSESTNTRQGWIARHPLLSLYLIMFGIQFSYDVPYILHSWSLLPFRMPDGLGLILTALGPAIAAAVVTAFISGRKGLRELFGRFLIARVSIWWYVLIFTFYVFDILGGNGLHVLFGGAKPVIPIAGDPLWQVVVKFVVFILFGILTNTEEVAWRGFALPRLQAKYNNALVAALLVAIPEVLLHVPDYFGNEMNFRKSVGVLSFTIFSLALSVVFAWVFINTKGSLLIVTLLHASGNAWSNLLTDNSVGPFYYSVALLVIFAIGIVIIYGPKNLSRQARE